MTDAVDSLIHEYARRYVARGVEAVTDLCLRTDDPREVIVHGGAVAEMYRDPLADREKRAYTNHF